MEVLQVTTRHLSVTLTEADILTHSRLLAATVREVAQEEAAQKEQKDNMKAKLSMLLAKITYESGLVHSGKEYREVEVEVRMGNGVAEEVRTDTGEIILTRPLTDQERQQRLDLEEEIDATNT